MDEGRFDGCFDDDAMIEYLIEAGIRSATDTSGALWRDNGIGTEAAITSVASTSSNLVSGLSKAERCGEHINASNTLLPRVILPCYSAVDSSTNTGRAHFPQATSEELQRSPLARVSRSWLGAVKTRRVEVNCRSIRS